MDCPHGGIPQKFCAFIFPNNFEYWKGVSHNLFVSTKEPEKTWAEESTQWKAEHKRQ